MTAEASDSLDAPTFESDVGALERRLRNVRDLVPRLGSLRAAVLQAGPAFLAECTALTLEPGRAPTSALRLPLAILLATGELDSLLESASAISLERGAIWSYRLLSADRMGRERAPRERGMADGDRPLTLGEKRSLARRRDRDLLQRLAREPDPVVIELVAKNPIIGERDMVRLLASRSLLGVAFRRVFSVPRWASNYAARLAALQNPAAPMVLSLAFIPLLQRPDIRRVKNAANLPHPLRMLAAAALETELSPS